MYHNNIAITIYGWFGGHAETCLGVACFVSGDIDAEIVETTFSFPKFRTVPGRFRFFYFHFFFLFPNVSRNENILF